MNEQFQGLVELQDLDRAIEEAEDKLEEFAPEIESLEEPVLAQQREVEKLRTRLDEMKQESRRLERGAEDKRAKLEEYEKRMERVKTARQEAAVRTETDLVRKAMEADEQEAVQLMERITRNELKLEELEEKLEAARAEIEPAKQELLEERNAAEEELGVLRDRRENHVVRIDDDALTVYERVRAGRTRMVVAKLTPDGACGHCFSMIPLQRRNEMRQDDRMFRCEACGVILYAED